MRLAPLIDTLAATPNSIQHLAELFPPDSLRWSPENWEGAPGEHFSPIGQVCHVRDIEADGYHVRFRRIREEVHPDLESIDSYALAEARDYDREDLTDALRGFREARATTIKSLRTLSEDELRRTATFAEHGVVTTEALIHLLYSHDLQHLSMMHWLLSRVTAR